jgi:hypothetical protein
VPGVASKTDDEVRSRLRIRAHPPFDVATTRNPSLRYPATKPAPILRDAPVTMATRFPLSMRHVYARAGAPGRQGPVHTLFQELE